MRIRSRPKPLTDWSLAINYWARTAPKPRPVLSKLQKLFYTYFGLTQNSPHRPLGQVTGMVRDSSAGSSLWVPPDFVTPLCLAIKDKTSPPQLLNYLIGTEASKPGHQTLTGMRTSPPAGAAAFSDGGNSSPCSWYDSTSFLATS